MMLGFGMATTSPQVLATLSGGPPPPPEEIAVQSVQIQAGAGKCQVKACTFQPAATGIVSLQYKTWPALSNIGILRTTNDGNPVEQTVPQAVVAESDFVVDYTINATDGVYLDQLTTMRLGPFTMPPLGGSGVYDGFPYIP